MQFILWIIRFSIADFDSEKSQFFFGVLLRKRIYVTVVLISTKWNKINFINDKLLLIQLGYHEKKIKHISFM